MNRIQTIDNTEFNLNEKQFEHELFTTVNKAIAHGKIFQMILEEAIKRGDIQNASN